MVSVLVRDGLVPDDPEMGGERMTLSPGGLGFAVGSALLLLPWFTPSTVAQEEGSGFLAANGRTTFRLYCANCHGSDGEGHGNIAKFLTVEPPDLTQIGRRHDGWPAERLYRIIDGREEVRTHGGREMPIWGDVFRNPLSDEMVREEGEENRADRKIRELVLFLRTLQVED